MATLTLRATVGRALTNDEIDENFVNLNSDIALRLLSTSYTAADVLTKVKTVDGSGSGLDADLLDGHNSDTTAASNTIALRDSSGNLYANQFIGAVTGNTSTATKLATARNLSLTGDATATLSSFDGSANVTAALTLATVNSNVGQFGTAGAIPVITVNGKGLVTAMSTVNVNTTISLAGTTGTGSVSSGGTITITPVLSSGITTAVSGSTFSIGIDAAVITTRTQLTTTLSSYATQTYVQTAGKNSQGFKYVSTAAPGATGADGDIWYRYA